MGHREHGGWDALRLSNPGGGWIDHRTGGDASGIILIARSGGDDPRSIEPEFGGCVCILPTQPGSSAVPFYDWCERRLPEHGILSAAIPVLGETGAEWERIHGVYLARRCELDSDRSEHDHRYGANRLRWFGVERPRLFRNRYLRQCVDQFECNSSACDYRLVGNHGLRREPSGDHRYQLWRHAKRKWRIAEPHPDYNQLVEQHLDHVH